MAEYNLGTAHGTVKIEADTTGVDKAGQSLENLGKKGQTTGQALDKVGNTMGVAGLAIAGGLGVAVATAASFEQELSGIAAVGGKDAAARMTEIHDKALEIGKATTFSASEAAQAMSELVKAGIPVTDVLGGAADATVALAAATGIDMPTAAQIASNAMNVFGISAKDMDGVVDTFAQTANASAIDITDLGMAMSQVGAVANLAGLSLEDTTTAIGELGDAGIKGSDAGTSLKTMLMNLQPSTKAAATAMKDLGIITEDGTNRFYDQEGNLKSLRDIQQILNDSTKDLTSAQKQAALETIFGSDAIRAAAVMADGGAEAYDNFGKKMDEQGSAAEQAKIRQDNMKGSLEALKGSLENTGIIVGEKLIPALRILVDWVGQLFDWFGNLPGPVQTLITYFAAASAAVLLLGSGIIKTVKFFGELKGAIGTLIGALTRKNVAEAESAAVSEGSAARSAAAWVGAKLKAVAAWVAMAASAALNAVKVAAIWIAETARAAAATVASWVAAAASTVAQWAVMAAGAVTNAVKITATWAAETAKTILATTTAWVTAAAKVAAQWVAMAAAATLNAAKVAAAWIVQNGTAVATSLASLAVAVGTTVAGWVAMAVTATINALIVAAAWLIAFWPIVLVVALIIGLAALIYIFWDEIVAAFEAAKNWIVEKMQALWEGIKAAWDWIVQKFQEAWQWIKDIFQGILDAVTGAWDSIVSAFAAAGQAVWDALQQTWQWIQDVWNNVINFFKQIPGWIMGVFSGAISWLVDAGHSILNGLWNGIKNVWTSVTGWFAQVGGWIKSAFSGALNWLLDAGANLIKGLWNGIVSVKDWILSKIGGFIGNIVSGIKDFFGIASPSRVTHEIGLNVGIGLANGIRDSLPQVSAAFGDMVRLGEVSSAQWDALIRAGWKGRPGDGMEALYRPDTPNARVDLGSVSDGQWAALLASGWKGDPGDGREALYPPDYFRNLETSMTSAMTTALTDGTVRSLTSGSPYLGGTLATMASPAPTPRASSSQAGTDAEFNKIINMEFNSYNPLPEKASDNEARQIRAAAAVGAF